MVTLSSKFYHKLMDVSSSTGIPPEHLLNIMAAESDINPSAGTGAVGLVQIMPQYLKNIGYTGTADQFKKEPGEEQLIYIENMIKSNMNKFNGGKPFKSVAQYYISNFLPASLALPGVQQEDPSTILAAKNPTTPHIPHNSIDFEKKVYHENAGKYGDKGMDTDGDKAITYGDIQKFLARARGKKSYIQALSDLKTHTNYSPKEKSPTLPATKKEDSAVVGKKERSGFNMFEFSKITDLLDKFYREIVASERSNKKLYKKYLPANNILIKIEAKDPIDSAEFARILCTALDEELLADAYTHIDNNNVEVECKIFGSDVLCYTAVNDLTDTLVDTFKDATRKIGGIKIRTDIIMNKKSSYQQITGKTAELNYRKFMFKFS